MKKQMSQVQIVEMQPEKEKESNPIFEALSFFGSTTRAGFQKLNELNEKK